MKKKLLLLACLFLGLGITGCGKEESKLDIFKNALLKDTNSISVKLTANAKIETEGVSLDISLPVVTKIEQNEGYNGYLKLDKNELIGIEQDIESYFTIDSKLSEVVLYLGYEHEGEKIWTKTEKKIDDETLKDFDLSNFKKEELKDIDKYVTDERVIFVAEEDSIKHYQFTVNDSLIEQIAKDLNEEYEKTGLEIKIDFYIDKDGNIVKILFDLMDALKEASKIADNKISMDDLKIIKTLNVVCELSEHNNTNVEIPEEVIKNAITTNDFYPTEEIEYN